MSAKEPDTSPKSAAYHAARGYPFKSAASAQAHSEARDANRAAETARVARAKAREKRDIAIVKRNALKGT
jgi:hypothetical protein